jgi:hypothetical protein
MPKFAEFSVGLINRLINEKHEIKVIEKFNGVTIIHVKPSAFKAIVQPNLKD